MSIPRKKIRIQSTNSEQRGTDAAGVAQGANLHLMRISNYLPYEQ